MAKRKTVTNPRNATNASWADHEVLGAIRQACRESIDGMATTTEIAIQMGFTANGKNVTLATKVASRLVYMRAIGQLESAAPDTTRPFTEPGSRDTRWKLTQDGEDFLRGKLSAPVRSAIANMGPGAQLQVMRELGVRGWRESDPVVAATLRREWEHHRAQRKVSFR